MTAENRAEAIIDLGAIASNIKHLMAISGKPALAVVKADAYGHGLVPVAKQALQAGATWLGVALLEEAVVLRENGVTAPIIAWLTPISDDFDSAVKNDIDIAIPSLEHLHAIIEAGVSTGKTPRIHLEVDTGMSRGGALLEWSELIQAAASAENSGKLKIVGIWSHFARADEPGHDFNREQRERFIAAVAEAKAVGVNPDVIHLSNSAATINDSDSHFDLVRLGISMYGLSPDVKTMGNSKELNLKPALKLRAKIHLVKDVPAGSSPYRDWETDRKSTRLNSSHRL